MHTQPAPTTRLDLDVLDGMHCAACVVRLERALAQVPTVRAVRVDLALRSASIDLTGAPADALAALDAAGFTVAPQAADPVAEAEHRRAASRRRALTALALAAPVAVLGMAHVEGWISIALQAGLSAAVLALPGRTILVNAVRGLWRRSPDMDVLVGTGAVAAWLLSAAHVISRAIGSGHHAGLWFESAALVIAFVLVGRWLEDRARSATTAALRALAARRPPTANLVTDAGDTVVPVASVRVDDRLRLQPGQLVPVDGVIESGQVAVDASLLTGEPLPVTAGPATAVVGGTMVVAGGAIMRTSAVGAASVLGRIIAMVRDAQAGKPPIARIADRLAGIFVPVVFALAAATWLLWRFLAPDLPGDAIVAAVTVLVVACPCALGLATPTAVAVAVGRAAQLGILIRDAAAIEALAGVDTVILDKTGTLTAGAPTVVAVHPPDQRSSILAIAAACSNGSRHPLARAICATAAADGVAIPIATDLHEEAGAGTRAMIAGREARCGNAAWTGAAGDAIIEAEGTDAGTVVHVAHGGQQIGRIDLADALRADAVEAVRRLLAMGIAVRIASGDRAAAVRPLAAALGIPGDGGMDPAGKLRLVRTVQAGGARVAMVGDGLNDAAALAGAGVAVAVAGGADVAVAAGALVVRSPTALADAIGLSRATLRTIRWNLAAAFGYNAVMLPLAMGAAWSSTGVLLDPMWAAAAMAASSLTVVGLSLRLRGWRHAA